MAGLDGCEAGVGLRGLVGQQRAQEVRKIDPGPVDLLHQLDAAAGVAAEEARHPELRQQLATDASLVQGRQRLIPVVRPLHRVHRPVDAEAR